MDQSKFPNYFVEQLNTVVNYQFLVTDFLLGRHAVLTVVLVDRTASCLVSALCFLTTLIIASC